MSGPENERESRAESAQRAPATAVAQDYRYMFECGPGCPLFFLRLVRALGRALDATYGGYIPDYSYSHHILSRRNGHLLFAIEHSSCY